MKLIACILLFLAACVAKADRAYPVTYSPNKITESGRVFPTGTSSGYLLKQKFIDEEATLEVRSKDGSLRIVHLGNIDIDDAVLAGDNMLILAQSDSLYTLILVDKTGQMHSKILPNITPNGKAIFADINGNEVLLLVSRRLYRVDFGNSFSVEPVAEGVTEAKFLKINARTTRIAYISITQSGMNLNILRNGKSEILTKLAAYENSKLRILGDTVVVLSGGANYGNSTLVQMITLSHGIIFESWVEANISLVEIMRFRGALCALHLKTDEENYIRLQDLKTGKQIYSVFLNERLIEPYKFALRGGNAIVFFRNGLVRFETSSGTISAIDYLPIGKHFRSDELDAVFAGHKIIITSDETSLVLVRHDNKLWLLTRYYRQAGKILIPLIFMVVIAVLLHYYRKQKKLLDLLQEHSGRGAILLLDKGGKLLRANRAAKELIGISESIPKHKNILYYCVGSGLQNLKEWISFVLANRDSAKQKIIIKNDNNPKEWLFSAVVLRNFAGRLRGIVINGMDITEELEKKRLNNWASLAHDMQTNLSTIRLNAEQLSIEPENENYVRREKIIHQVNVLIQRVRDIVTVGRSDSLDKQQYDVQEICKEVISEFDQNMFPHVEFVLAAIPMPVICDKPKMIRALRNAIENAIRALKGKPGTVSISNYSDAKNVCFVIRDSGVGMDQKTKSKMLTPYFTTGAKEGGFGIGTMIMQHVVDMHDGEIIINSESGKGTELIFSIPSAGKTPVRKNYMRR